MVRGMGVKPLKVQLGNDGGQQFVNARTSRVKHKVRRFFVQSISQLIQAAQFFKRVIDLQEWSLQLVLC